MTPPDLVNWIARSRQAFRAPFDLLAQLINTSVDLTPAQAWHLDEAAAFTASLGIADQTAGTPGQAVQREPRLTERICRIALDASGLDPALLIAQLRSLRDENPEHPDWGLLFQPSDRDPGIELAPETIDTDVALQALRSGNSWLVSLVLLLAANASRLPEGFPDQLVTVLPTLSVKTRLRTAILLAHRWPDLSLPDSDPATRAGAARVRARTLAATQHHRDALDLLADPDLLVRAEAASFLYRVPPDVKAALEEALATPAEQWTCIHCGTVMPDTADACPHRHPRPQPLLAAD